METYQCVVGSNRRGFLRVYHQPDGDSLRVETGNIAVRLAGHNNDSRKYSGSLGHMDDRM